MTPTPTRAFKGHWVVFFYIRLEEFYDAAQARFAYSKSGYLHRYIII